MFTSDPSLSFSAGNQICGSLYDISGHQRWRSHSGEKSIIVNQEWKNEHFNVITDNEALAIEIELQNGEKVILAAIYYPNGNPSLYRFHTKT